MQLPGGACRGAGRSGGSAQVATDRIDLAAPGPEAGTGRGGGRTPRRGAARIRAPGPAVVPAVVPGVRAANPSLSDCPGRHSSRS